MKDDKKLELDFSKSIPRKQPREPYKKPGNLDSIIKSFNNETNKIKYDKDFKSPKDSLPVRIPISLLLFFGYYYFVLKYMVFFYGTRISFFASIGFIFYLFISYKYRPKPDMNNLGYLGGLINKPFDYTDDVNRLLLYLKYFLLPGVLISETIVDFYLYYIKKD